MTQSQFQEIVKMVRSLHLDFEDGINDEQAFDMANFIIDDNPGLKEFINENVGASDAVGWLMCEMQEDKTMDAKGLYNFIMLCLKDDDGISEEAYQQLIEHLIEINQPEIVIEINSRSRTANGRRYIND